MLWTLSLLRQQGASFALTQEKDALQTAAMCFSSLCFGKIDFSQTDAV